MTAVATATGAGQESAFDASAYDLPIPKDRYGRKADKLVVALGNWEPDRTSEDDLAVFELLEKGREVELRVVCVVTTATEVSKITGDEESAEIRRVLEVVSVESVESV